jgi:hypothetical protein
MIATRLRRGADALIPTLAAVLLAASAGAHDLSALTQRELVRVQGYRAPAPSGVEVERQLTLVVLGETLHFAANEWRVFTLQDAKDTPTPAEPPQIILQGDRPLLRRIATAHADQRVTILAERRVGGGDLFVLAVDLCPEK